MKKALIIKFIVFIILFFIALLVALPKGPDLDLTKLKINFKKELKVRKGLDLQGGTQLVYDLDTSKESNKKEAQEKAIAVIRNRIDAFGVSEPVIYPETFGNSYRVVVQLPGVQNIDEAINLIGKTAQLEFKESEPMPVSSSSEVSPMILGGNWKEEPALTGADFKRANVTYDDKGEIGIDIEFNSEGAKKFAEATKRNIGQQIAIFLDDELLSSPVVQTEIPSGNARITGKFNLQEAKGLAIQLNAGALPVPMDLAEQKNIGATLGQDSVNKSILAGIIGLTAVIIFLLAFYRILGLLAIISLIFYSMITLSIFKLFSVTLTLAGIAGFILSTGAAADASILILERIREELRNGKTLVFSIERGLRGAWSSIWISNIVSLILASVIFYLGTGLIRGFAVTLGIGIMISLFTVVAATEPILKFLSFRKFINKKKIMSILLGIKEQELRD